MVTKRVDYYDSAGDIFEGYLAIYGNSSFKKPALLAVHNRDGLINEFELRAEEFARLGYIGFAIDMYGKGKRPSTPEEASSNTTYLRENPDVMRRRAQAAFDYVSSLSEVDSSKLGACGYCFGGTVVLEMSRSETAPSGLRGVVSFHGDPIQIWPEGYNKFTGSVVVIHGGMDTSISDEDVLEFEQEAREQEIDWVTIKLGNAAHGFATRPSGAYDPIADRRSHGFAFDFFEERFNLQC